MSMRSTFHEADVHQLSDIIDKWSAPVLSTMGANGRVVIIGRPEGNVYTQDGITVARNTVPDTPLDRAVFRAVVDAAHQQVNDCGDGTTTTTALVVGLMREISSHFSGRKVTSEELNELIKFLQDAVKKTAKRIRESARPIIVDGVLDKDALRHVAGIACHHNDELADVVAELVAKTGADGNVRSAISYTGKTFYEYHDGYVAQSGLINEYFWTHDHMRSAILDNPVVLIADQVIEDTDDMVAIFKAYSRFTGGNHKANPLVIICDDMYGGALNTLIQNLPKMGPKVPIPACVIKAPMSFTQRNDLLSDLAHITGAYVFKKVGGVPVSQINKDQTKNYFGRVDKVVAGMKTTMFQLKDRVLSNERIEILKKVKEESKEEQERKFIDERISRLSSGIGTIFVGGETQAEHTWSDHLVEDAVLACREAMRHGVVPGGGMALVGESFNEMLNSGEAEDGILLGACSFPAITIAGEYEDLLNKCGGWNVIDARTGNIVNAWDAGIIDPASVPATALEKAMSVVKQLVLSNQIITVEDETESSAGAGHPASH